MQSYLNEFINGVHCPAIYEMMKIGFPRTTCYDGNGVFCKFLDGDHCLISGDATEIQNRERPTCKASLWLSKIGQEMGQFGSYGGTPDQLNHFLEDRLKSESLNMVSQLATHIIAAINDAFSSAGLVMTDVGIQSRMQQALDMSFTTFFGQYMALVKFASNTGVLIGFQTVPTMKDIPSLAGGIKTDLFNKNMERIDESFAKIRKQVQEDETPVTATISRKEVKRLRIRVSELEKRLNKLTANDATPVEVTTDLHEESSRESHL